MKPGAAMRPFFGVQPAVIDEKGTELSGACEGLLAVKGPWPAAIRAVYGDYDRFVATYFPIDGGFYLTGDGCRRDADVSFRSISISISTYIYTYRYIYIYIYLPICIYIIHIYVCICVSM